ncbi:MAG: MMPL family transporter [Dehalococcoidia bacterium]|nr:MMPL family transporter [Dehalococcoidia bacterium]
MTDTLGPTGRLASWSARHRWRVVAGWLVLLVASSFAASIAGGTFTTAIEFTNQPDSQRAFDLLRDYRGNDPLYEQVVVRSADRTTTDPAFRALVAALVADLRQHPDAIDPASTFSYLDAGAAGLVSADGHTTLVPTRLTGELDTSPERLATLHTVLEQYHGRDGFHVINGGFASVNEAFNDVAEGDLSTEIKVLPLALVVLVVVFGAAVAALVPMGVAFLAIGITFGVVTVITSIWPLSSFVSNIITVIGLAVGIDYALIIVARFREQRRAGHSVEESIDLAGDTASRAVLFSGGTVVIGLGGLLIVPTTIFRSFGIGAITVVIFAVAASLTLVPALLSLLGDRVNRLAVPLLSRGGQMHEDRGFWAAAARVVMRRPLLMAVGSATLLVLLSLPYFSIQLGASGAASIPERFAVRQVFDILDREFSAGQLAPTEIVVSAADVRAPAVQRSLERLEQALETDAAIRQTAEVQVSPAGDLAIVTVAVPGDIASDEAVAALRRLRAEVIPAAFSGSGAEVYVGGQTATNADFFALVDRYTPIVFVFVLGFSFVLLLLLFRSVVVPVKAIAMNLLSVGAAYGVITAIFQLGWGSRVLPFQRVSEIEAWLPLFMFTILFGLSMDYHIFLISRIRERYDETLDNTASVAFGLRSTANIITGAAAIMVTVFGGFALGELVMFQQVGVGLAVAVFLDATIVRTVLVPSTMRLLGRANWYMPRWLLWLPDLRVERTPTIEGTPAGGGASGA